MRDAGLLRTIGAVLLADLRERTRAPRWRVTLAITALVAWACFPPPSAGYLVVAIGDHYRGMYSSAWIGMVCAMTTTLWAIVGFFVVRGTVQRDLETRVWPLLGASAMSRTGYLAAKWLGHLLVLLTLLGTMLAVGLVAQWVRAEDRHLDPWELVKPALVIALPMLAVVATLAIWFDLLPRLRRTAGGVVFFLVWVTVLSAGGLQVAHGRHGAGTAGWRSDLAALVLMQQAIDAQVRPQAPELGRAEGFCIGCGSTGGAPKRFAWTRWDVAPAAVAGRLAWIVAALGGVLLAAPWLDRFAARAGRTPATAANARPPRRLRWLRIALAPLERSAHGTLVAAQAHALLRRRAGWWWIAWGAAWTVQVVASPADAALAMLGAWTLLLDAFAHLALQERANATAALVLTAPGASRRLLAARAVLLVALAWIAVAPGALAHPALAGPALLIGASLALWGLAGAVVARSGRPFELAFLVVAYATSQGLPWLDAHARDPGTMEAHAAGLALALGAIAWRWDAGLRAALRVRA